VAKYSFEFKKKIVLEYLAGKGGSDFLFVCWFKVIAG
jgi:hypothetical protein